MTDSDDTRVPATISLRPVGSALPLGFIGLAVATLTLTGLELGWVDRADAHAAGIVMLATAVPLQIIATVFALWSRDTASAGQMATLAVTWAFLGIEKLVAPPGATSGALGLGLLASGGLLFGSLASVALGKPLAAFVSALAATRFVFSGIYELTAARGWREAAGGVGIAVVAAAAYASWAFELEDARHAPLLPTLRRRRARVAGEGPLSAQLAPLAHEAGVRRQL